MTFGAVPSIELIGIASPHGSGVVERSPCCALPLNAEPLACHIDDCQLSAGYREVEPAREGFVFQVAFLPSWDLNQPQRRLAEQARPDSPLQPFF